MQTTAVYKLKKRKAIIKRTLRRDSRIYHLSILHFCVKLIPQCLSLVDANGIELT